MCVTPSEGEDFTEDCGDKSVIDFAHFDRWWQSRVKQGPVTKITSEEEWGDILKDPENADKCAPLHTFAHFVPSPLSQIGRPNRDEPGRRALETGPLTG